MAYLTESFSPGGELFFRRKKFILSVGIFILVAAFAVSGFYLYRSKKSVSYTAPKTHILPSSWLIKYFGVDDENNTKVGGLSGDPDYDLLNNFQEFFFNTNPSDPDTDKDGQIDGAEVAVNSNPKGDGVLYESDFAKEVADRFVEENGLVDFKQENIEKQINGLLNPPTKDQVVVTLPKESELNMIRDDSDKAVDKYFADINASADHMRLTTESLKELIIGTNQEDPQVMIGSMYEMVDKLRAMPVPAPFLKVQQLQIVGLFATAKIFEISKNTDPNIDLEQQSDKIREQYYQVAVIEKSDELMAAEMETLRKTYGDIIAKYQRK